MQFQTRLELKSLIIMCSGKYLKLDGLPKSSSSIKSDGLNCLTEPFSALELLNSDGVKPKRITTDHKTANVYKIRSHHLWIQLCSNNQR